MFFKFLRFFKLREGGEREKKREKREREKNSKRKQNDVTNRFFRFLIIKSIGAHDVLAAAGGSASLEDGGGCVRCEGVEEEERVEVRGPLVVVDFFISPSAS